MMIRACRHGVGGGFETERAVKAGLKVYAEYRSASKPGDLTAGSGAPE